MRVALLAAFAACSSPAPRQVAATPPARPPAATPVDPPPPSFRLPGDVRPRSYELELTIVPDQASATGRIRIAAEVVRPARVVWLNATDLAIARAELDGKPARVIIPAGKGGADFVGLTVDRELAAGPHAIDVSYAAPIDRTRSRAIYSEREGSEAYVYTFFEPIDARRAFPCFDEPSYKVPWQLTFHVKQDHVALANAPVERETPEAGGMKKVEIAPTRPLPSYLVAFVVGPFELVDGGTVGRVKTPIRFILPKGRAGELGYARQITPRVVGALEDYFDMAYPYGKLDVAVVPRFWGTMEHPGIVAMGQPLTLIRPDQETRDRKERYASILAHELSHYWFGDLVTMAWWDDTWLNEALGSWSDVNITEAAEPSWRIRDGRIGTAVNAMRADETLSARMIRQAVARPEDIEASFDNQITYYKGSSVFRMFESFVSRERWRAFIHGYLRAHAWGNASAEDFLASMTENLGAATTTALRTFLEQPGVPRIAAQLRCEPRKAPSIAITQQRALPAGVTDPQPRLWSLPVCIRYGDARASFEECVSLSTATAVFELGSRSSWRGCPTWIISNADAAGYYRSTVDPALARALLTPGSPLARAARPTPPERMMLVEDLRAAVRRDELPIDKMLALALIAASDPDDKVARTAVGAATAAVPMIGLDDAMLRAARRWYHGVFHARARRLGWQRGAKDSDDLQDLRQAIVPLVAIEDRELTAEATRLADRWLADRTGVADDLVDSVLEAAARHGDAARFDRVLAAARAARDRNEKQRLLRSLGDFTDPAIARKGLALVLGRDLDLRDTLGILYGVLGNRETRDLAIAFIAEHLDDLLARMRDDDAAGLLGRLAGRSCDATRGKQIADIIVPRAARIGGAENQVTRGLEQAEQCIAYLQRQLPGLHRVLDAK
ncbi:MAG TPA: M1 family metallopeptidase [Kofleriaceae bacterium]